MRRLSAYVAALVVVSLVPPAAATTLLSLDLDALTTAADRIFVGRVVSVRNGRDADGFAATWTEFAVDETLKGAVPARLTVKQLATDPPPDGGAIFRVPGLPAYHDGETVLLFLNRDSPAGFTSPVGLAQGCFRVEGTGDGARARNDVGNLNLGTPPASSAAAVARVPSPPDTSSAVAPSRDARAGRADGTASTSPAAIPLVELVDRIRALETAHDR